MSIEELKAAVDEAMEADLFDLTHIDTEEEDIFKNPSCNDCPHYDDYLFDCKLQKCPYNEDDELEVQEILL